MKYKILIEHRNYIEWSIVNANDFTQVSLSMKNPAEFNLFNNDIFTFNKEKVNIEHSLLRNTEAIAGVLLLENNKTYGRFKDKLLYRCIPDDIRVPSFLIPYEIKKMGFSKSFINLYVTFRFNDWSDKHPRGVLQQVIGPVDILENFYEYQLYCKSLNTSIQKFHKDTIRFLKQKAEDNENLIDLITKEYPELEDRTDLVKWNIFSIDPENSADFDDAFSIHSLNTNKTSLSIYISNVTIWIDYLNLWNSFSRRISTIYLPDKKRPMLPTILSDCLCSLQENKKRAAFVLDIIIENGEIVSLSFSNCIIRVKKNYVYEESNLLKLSDYQLLITLSKQLSKKYKYLSKIVDSHDVVSYFMILMNFYCAKDLHQHNNGIFRSTSITNKKIDIPPTVPEEVSKFITIWNSFSGQYINLSDHDNISDIRHEALNMDAYIHITSPIRRLVDLLNMIQFQKNNNMIILSEDAEMFFNKWVLEIEYINTTMRSIRKVQNDCHLLQLCSSNPDVLDKKYNGYCFDRIIRHDGLYQFMVYIPEIKMTSRIIIQENLTNYTEKQFRLFIFNNEEKMKKKIRLQIM